MWSIQSEKIKQEKERGIIMSVFIENAIKRYVDGRYHPFLC
jgi:hypothetical protein